MDKSLKIHSIEVSIEVFFINRGPLEVLKITKLSLIGFWHLKARFEDIDSIYSCTYQHFVVDWMISDFLYLLLALMQEHQLIRHFFIDLLILN